MNITNTLNWANDVLAENVAEQCRIKTYGMSTYTVDPDELHARQMAAKAVTNTTGLTTTEINYIGQYLNTPYDN